MKTVLLRTALLVGLVVSALSCDKDDEDPVTNPPTNNPSLPATISGTVANMEFTTANVGAPYTLNQKVNFTFSSSGMLFIDVDPAAANGDEVNIASFTLVGQEYVWEDTQAGFKYALSLTSNSEINEINVSNLSGSFLGQFTPIATGGNTELDLIKAMAGNYAVTNVSKGAHTRMSVTIAANGDIDFDTGLQFVTADYELISDRLDVLDGVWIDMTPYPTEPYPRLQIFVDPTDRTKAVNMLYSPSYPNVSGRVEIDF